MKLSSEHLDSFVIHTPELQWSINLVSLNTRAIVVVVKERMHSKSIFTIPIIYCH